ncbi:uncharacterized protein LOC117918211 [Vitis riparia]|uniref:uncharacterized protein LOC117918211 n=1 Tax=Vitis riparia TaxID=96939 RepID=UPI00155A43E2|nr:uncharacterized protein LOC117918211 [Vitis riparia]
MGNYVSFRPCSAAGKIVLSDGSVHEFIKPVIVAELMLEHPQQVVVELNSGKGSGGKRPSPLPADMKLEMGKVYLMLPMKRGRAVTLSSEEARRVLLRASSVLQSQSFLSSSRLLPFFAKICPAGTGDGPGYVLNRKEKSLVMESPEERCKPEFDLPEALEGRPEYLSRQFSGKGWKPSLDTIEEKKIEKKVPHWLF